VGPHDLILGQTDGELRHGHTNIIPSPLVPRAKFQFLRFQMTVTFPSRARQASDPEYLTAAKSANPNKNVSSYTRNSFIHPLLAGFRKSFTKPKNRCKKPISNSFSITYARHPAPRGVNSRSPAPYPELGGQARAFNASAQKPYMQKITRSGPLPSPQKSPFQAREIFTQNRSKTPNFSLVRALMLIDGKNYPFFRSAGRGKNYPFCDPNSPANRWNKNSKTSTGQVPSEQNEVARI
jgi:hypothetical protein